MKTFYAQSKPCQWTLALFFLIAFLALVAAVSLSIAALLGLRWNVAGQLIIAVYGNLCLLLPIWMLLANFFTAPFFRLIGVCRYYSPYLIVTGSPARGLQLHGATLFDYWLLLGWKERGRPAVRRILIWYLEGLVALARDIETGRLPMDVPISATTYIFSKRSAQRHGFKVDSSRRFLLGGLLTYPTQFLTYSFARGRWAFPDLSRAKQATISGRELCAHIGGFERLLKRLRSQSDMTVTPKKSPVPIERTWRLRKDELRRIAIVLISTLAALVWTLVEYNIDPVLLKRFGAATVNLDGFFLLLPLAAAFVLNPKLRRLFPIRLTWTWISLIPLSAVFLNLAFVTHPQCIGSGFQIATLIIGGFATGLQEELFFRGFAFFRAGEPKPRDTVFLTTICFSLMHLLHFLSGDTMLQVEFALCFSFAFGLALGIIRIVTGSIAWGVLIHGTVDATLPFANTDSRAYQISAAFLMFTILVAAYIVFLAHPAMRKVSNANSIADAARCVGEKKANAK
jgi:membrane protease YdiL (CAAX protease family)